MRRVRQTLNNRVTPRGNDYTGATGKWDGSFDVMERQAGTGKLSAELNYGEDGFSVSGNADFGNGLGLGAENGRNGTTGSLTLLGSTQGTVNEDGIYEANSNFLGEISGQDIIDLHNTIAQQEGNATIEDAARNAPAKSAKDAANFNNPVDDKDNDAQEEAGSQGSEGLVDLVFAGTAVLVSAGAAFLAGGGSGSATPSSPAGGQGGAGNGINATVARKPEDEKDTDKPVGHDNEDPSKGLTRDELSDYKELQNRLRNGEELNPVDAERHAQLAEIRNIELNANSLSQAGQEGAPTRNTQEEIRRLRDIDSLNDLNAAAFVGLRTIDANESPAMTAANENNPKNNRLQIAGGYENSNLFDRFTQSISNTFMGRGFFLNDRELVRRDQSRMGARGELNMVSELGYNLTEEQINNKNRLSIIDREKERIRQSYNFTDGHINVNRINRGDRLIYNRIHLDELSLARSVELDRVRAERVYTQPATDRRPGDQEGANRGRGESGHTEQVGSYFPAYDMNNVPRGSFPLGTPYRPVFNGVVDSRLYGELNDGYGNQIRIDHGHGVSTLYAHNSELLVLPGDRVDDNTVIAAVGNTGSVSPQPTTANPEAGTHIHFELRIGGVRYESVNFDWNRFAIEGQTYVNEFRRNHR